MAIRISTIKFIVRKDDFNLKICVGLKDSKDLQNTCDQKFWNFYMIDNYTSIYRSKTNAYIRVQVNNPH